MARSADYLRLAPGAAPTLADAALDSLPDAIVIVDVRVRHLPIVFANAAARQGFSSDANATTLTGLPLTRLMAPDSRAGLEASLGNLAKGQRRVLVWRLASGEQPAVTDLRPLPGKPGQKLIMLSFSAALEPRDRPTAVENLPLGLLVIDADLNVIYASSDALRAADHQTGVALGSSALPHALAAALHPDVFTQAFQGRRFHDDALAVSGADGWVRKFDIDVQPLRSETGITGVAIAYIEITQRSPQRSTSEGEQRMLALTEHARDIIAIADRDGRLIYVSGGARNSLGWTADPREGLCVFDHIHPDELAEARAKYCQLVAGEIGSYSKDCRVRHQDGTYRWLESSYSLELDNPLIGGVVINARDITERKDAEMRLAQREEIFRLAADAVDGIIFEWDIASGAVRRSRGVLEVLGLQPEQIEPSVDSWYERVHPLDFAAARRCVSMALLRERGWTVTYRIRDVTGAYRSILERALLQRNPAGDPVRAIGCCVDVSEIKRLTDILADTQRAAQIGGWEYNFETRQIIWTDEMFRIFGTDAKEFPPSPETVWKLFVPESAQILREALEDGKTTGKPLDLEVEVATLPGLRLWVRLIAHIDMVDGRPLRAFGSLQNIQAQKQVQIELENSTDWLKLSMKMAHMHAWRWDRADDTIKFATTEGRAVYSANERPSMALILERMHPQDRPRVESALGRVFDRHAEIREEFQILGVDGRYRHYASTARPVFEADRQPRGLVGVVQDVTEQRESERRLRQSEELLQVTTANSADTLFLLDTGLRVRFINKNFNGRRLDEILGNEVEALLPPSARAGVRDKLRHVLSSGEGAAYEFEAQHNGQKCYFENCAVLVREEGVATGISVSMRDVTQRRLLEREILDISGRERDSIGRDLHDGLGQELTGVALMLRGLTASIKTRCPDIIENINEVVGLVNQSIETARSLARGLLPVRSETGGLRFALQALAMRSRDLYGLDVSFRAEMSAELALDETNASHLYRIAQEALTNAARHGRATRVEIVLTSSARHFALQIADDGQGYTPSAASPGMGLKIMKYRAGMIRARFAVEPNHPHGTIVQVTGERESLNDSPSDYAILGEG